MIRTKFASAEREDKKSIRKQYETLKKGEFIHQLLDALPYPAAILNEHRQLIYGNNELSNGDVNVTIEQMLGERPGEILHCKFSTLEEGGCGTSEYCRVCGAVRAILDSQQSGKKTSKECQITTKDNNGKEHALDVLVTATPFNWNSEKYTVLSMNDISHEKRRRMLERIFFHDILDKAGSLNGFFDILKDVSNSDKMIEFIDLASDISNELVDEIKSQRTLMDAETGDLKIHREEFLSLDVIQEVVNQILHHKVAENKRIKIDDTSENITIKTDPVLLHRVLTNMLKNALEAIDEKDEVLFGCKKNGQKLSYWVNNPAKLPESVKLQIFKRSFSTKGTDRGLGTYSMKLLGERYLQGNVYFISSEKTGTTFYIDIPV
jgi:K+-sensing histidine kinase KdpD